MGSDVNIKDIEGVKIDTRNEGVWICHIEEFFDELKSLIRKRLIEICRGYDLSLKSTDKTYKIVLKSFFENYLTKSSKIGAIGELLSHILIVHNYDYFETISPMFNTHSKFPKLGFDILFVENDSDIIWYTEVKASTQVTKNKDPQSLSEDLIDKAKEDNFLRLSPESSNTVWSSAIADVNSSRKHKESIIEIFLSISEDRSNIIKNVFLVPVVFNDKTEDKTIYSKTLDKKNDIVNEKIFNKIIIFSIQKKTHTKIIEFLKSELE